MQQLGKAQAASLPVERQASRQPASPNKADARETDARHWSAEQIAQLASSEASRRLSQMQSQVPHLSFTTNPYVL